MAVTEGERDVSRGFYEKRDLPCPRAEYWPEDAGELQRLVVDGADTPRLLLGDGQHARTAVVGERTFDAIRTEKCRRILSVDRESKLVRVEAGLRWGDLQDELRERGLSLERYRLYPASATIGGLLARRQPVHRDAWDGDIRTGCCALSAVAPVTGDYRYIVAPRKASGPDLRFLFIGGEGLCGAILDATLVAWEPTGARLFEWTVDGAADAIEVVSFLHDVGARISWAYYNPLKTSDDRLAVAIHGPGPVLDATEDELVGAGFDFEVSGRDAVAELRQKLESGHPDRRSLTSSRRTLSGVFSLADLAASTDAIADSVESVQVYNLGRRRAEVFMRFPDGETPSELPSPAGSRALSVRPVSDDELVHWPYWAQNLKQELDPDRNLAAGP